MPDFRIIQGDALESLRGLPADSVDCCVTSPPYFGLRDYGVEGQMGLEPTPEAFVQAMVEVFREVRRVLKPTGTLWLNLGDSYAGARQAPGQTDSRRRDNAVIPRSDRRVSGLKAKDLIGIPWMVAFALRADGWYLRRDIIWNKPNPMPEAVKDRPSTAHEYVFLLTKEARYFYDWEAISTPISPKTLTVKTTPTKGDGTSSTGEKVNAWMAANGGRKHPARANRRSVWTISSRPFKGAHFATFPEKLVEPCILAGTSEKGICPSCGAPWTRLVEKGEPDMDHRRACGADAEGGYKGQATKDYSSAKAQDPSAVKARILAGMVKRITTGWAASCSCGLEPVPALVLDPFAGSGTVGAVALRHFRRFVGIELNPAYAEMATRRVAAAVPGPPLFREVANG